MSVQRARKTLRGESADRIALFDLPEHPGLIRYLTGIDAFKETERGVSEAVKALDVDLLMCGIPEQTNASASDEHLIAVGSTKWRNEETTSRDFFNYDPAIYRTDCASLSEDACAVLFQGYLDRNRRLTGGAALPIGYCFTTCIHYAAEDLNWPDFLMACMTDEEKVSLLLDKF